MAVTPPRPDIAPRRRRRQLEQCRRGELPAEALDPADREHLVYDLHALGWTDVEIAAHTRMSTYTTARIRARLGLPPRPAARGLTAREGA